MSTSIDFQTRGRKPVLLMANAVFFVGSLLAGVSVSIGMLITARAIQGIGGGGLIVLVNICIGDLFSQRYATLPTSSWSTLLETLSLSRSCYRKRFH